MRASSSAGSRDRARTCWRGRRTGPAAARTQGAGAGRLRRGGRFFNGVRRKSRLRLHRGGAPPLAGAASRPDTGNFWAHRPSQQCAMPDPLHSAQVTSKNRPLTEMGKAAPKGIGGARRNGPVCQYSAQPMARLAPHLSAPNRERDCGRAISVRQCFRPKTQAMLTEGCDGNNGLPPSAAQQRRLISQRTCRKIQQF